MWNLCTSVVPNTYACEYKRMKEVNFTKKKGKQISENMKIVMTKLRCPDGLGKTAIPTYGVATPKIVYHVTSGFNHFSSGGKRQVGTSPAHPFVGAILL